MNSPCLIIGQSMHVDQLNMILAGHSAWLESGGRAGECANLRGANLRGADLRGADLRGAILFNAKL